jgi:hypothetical protein
MTSTKYIGMDVHTDDLLPRNLIQTKVNFSGYKAVKGEGV